MVFSRTYVKHFVISIVSNYYSGSAVAFKIPLTTFIIIMVIDVQRNAYLVLGHVFKRTSSRLVRTYKGKIQSCHVPDFLL